MDNLLFAVVVLRLAHNSSKQRQGPLLLPADCRLVQHHTGVLGTARLTEFSIIITDRSSSAPSATISPGFAAGYQRPLRKPPDSGHPSLPSARSSAHRGGSDTSRDCLGYCAHRACRIDFLGCPCAHAAALQENTCNSSGCRVVVRSA